MTKEISEKQREQQHLDHVLDLINDKEKELKSSIKSAEGEARDINSHFLRWIFYLHGNCAFHSSTTAAFKRT